MIGSELRTSCTSGNRCTNWSPVQYLFIVKRSYSTEAYFQPNEHCCFLGHERNDLDPDSNLKCLNERQVFDRYTRPSVDVIRTCYLNLERFKTSAGIEHFLWSVMFQCCDVYKVVYAVAVL